MSTETDSAHLPGLIGTALGFTTLLELFGLYDLSLTNRIPPYGISAPLQLYYAAWALSPFIGLAGVKVKKQKVLRGLLFLIAGILPWAGSSQQHSPSLTDLVFFFWTPLLVLAGLMSILNWPGPHVGKHEDLSHDRREEAPSSCQPGSNLT